MHILEDLRYVLEDMIEPVIKKGDISPTELDSIYKAVKTIYYTVTTESMLEYGDDYSNDGSSYGRNSRYSYPSSYEGGSYADRRYSRARNRRNSYSRDEKEDMIARLERKMNTASSESERQTIRDMIREIENER